MLCRKHSWATFFGRVLRKGFNSFSRFIVCCWVLSDARKYLIGTQKMLRLCPPAGMDLLLKSLSMIVESTLFKFCLGQSKRAISDLLMAFYLYVNKSESGNYKFCPGMNVEVFNDTYASVLQYESSVRVATEPFSWVDSPNCSMWHRLARNASIFEKDMDDVMCQPCEKMRSHLDQRVRVSLAVTPTKKAVCLEPSSSCPLSALSPASVNERRENLMAKRAQDKDSESMNTQRSHWMMIRVMKWLD